MKKIIFTLTLCLGLVLMLTACGTNNESASNDTDLAGAWTYQEPNDQDPTLIVTFDFLEDGTYEVEVTKNVLQDNLNNSTSVIEGTYEDNGTTLAMTVDQIDSEKVDDAEPLDLAYTLSGDSEKLTINGANEISPDIPESIELSRQNASD